MRRGQLKRAIDYHAASLARADQYVTNGSHIGYETGSYLEPDLEPYMESALGPDSSESVGSFAQGSENDR
jgi:hypothetical protein